MCVLTGMYTAMNSGTARGKNVPGNVDLNEGDASGCTAARTRPLSFDEIMSRRKRKKSSGDIENQSRGTEQTGNLFKQKKREKYAGFLEEDSSSSPDHCSKTHIGLYHRSKTARYATKTISKGSSELKEEPRQEMVSDMQKKTMVGMSKRLDVRRKISKHFHENSESESEGKHARHYPCGSELLDGYRRRPKSEITAVQYTVSYDSDKYSGKKYDRSHGKYSKTTEKRGYRESPSPTYYEETRHKKRRSKFWENDRLKEVPVSTSPMIVSSTSHDHRQHGNHSPHARTKRVEKHSLESDKCKLQANGLSSYDEKHPTFFGRLTGSVQVRSEISAKKSSPKSSPEKQAAAKTSPGDSPVEHIAAKTSSPIFSPVKKGVSRTPSPRFSPGKKSVGWDQPSERSLCGNSAPDRLVLPPEERMSSPFQVKELPAPASTTITPMPSISSLSINILMALKSASIDSVQLTQATRPMRRLHIENVPTACSEKALMESFNTFLLSSGANHIIGTRPCISCTIHKERGQAFVEFLTPEDASAALSFDGKYLSGSVLKVRRPKDFVEVAVFRKLLFSCRLLLLLPALRRPTSLLCPPRLHPASSPMTSSILLIKCTSSIPPFPFFFFILKMSRADLHCWDFRIHLVPNGDPFFCLFPAHTHTHTHTLSLHVFVQLVEIVNAFGSLKAFRFRETSEGLKGASAFVEYVDGAVTQRACAGLNGLIIGGRVLTAVQPFPDQPSSSYDVPPHARPLLADPTPVLKLTNVLNEELLAGMAADEVERVVEDVRLECSRYGPIRSMNLVTGGCHDDVPQSSSSPGAVLIEYRRIQGSRAAAHALHGRSFDTRLVSAEYVPLSVYRQMFTD